jgi:hemolysin expression modulating protein
MTRSEYLMRFRRCRKLITLETVYDHMKETVKEGDMMAFESAADHRRAEIIHGKLWDKIPLSAWANVR